MAMELLSGARRLSVIVRRLSVIDHPREPMSETISMNTGPAVDLHAKSDRRLDGRRLSDILPSMKRLVRRHLLATTTTTGSILKAGPDPGLPNLARHRVHPHGHDRLLTGALAQSRTDLRDRALAQLQAFAITASTGNQNRIVATVAPGAPAPDRGRIRIRMGVGATAIDQIRETATSRTSLIVATTTARTNPWSVKLRVALLAGAHASDLYRQHASFCLLTGGIITAWHSSGHAVFCVQISVQDPISVWIQLQQRPSPRD